MILYKLIPFALAFATHVQRDSLAPKLDFLGPYDNLVSIKQLDKHSVRFLGLDVLTVAQLFHSPSEHVGIDAARDAGVNTAHIGQFHRFEYFKPHRRFHPSFRASRLINAELSFRLIFALWTTLLRNV